MCRRQLVGDHDRRDIGQRECDADGELEQRRGKSIGHEGPGEKDDEVYRAPDGIEAAVTKPPGEDVRVTHRRYLGQRLEGSSRPDDQSPSAEEADPQSEEVLRRRKRRTEQECADQKSNQGHRHPRHAVGHGRTRGRLDRLTGQRGRERAPHPHAKEQGQGRVHKGNEPEADDLKDGARHRD